MAPDTRPTETIQTWPAGTSYTYRGDIDGPPEQRQLKTGHDRAAKWRKGTADEWRAIRINVRARMYGDRDVHGCDSALVDDLIKAASAGEISGDLGSGFSYDEIRNQYKNPENWTPDECREYAQDHGLDLPDVDPCAEHEEHDEHCAACAEMYEDDSRRGWLTDAREVCRDHAQENPAEVYEWWRVSSWLCEQLHSAGEVTINNGYGYWWGRTCTGQGWIMDGTLQTIAARFEQ